MMGPWILILLRPDGTSTSNQDWIVQEMPACFDQDILAVAELVFDDFYDPNAAHTDVREYCKREECWKKISTIPYELSDGIMDGLK